MVLPGLEEFSASRIQPPKKLYIQKNRTGKQFKDNLIKSLLPRHSIYLNKEKCRFWVTDSNPSTLLSYLSSKAISPSSYCKDKNTELQDYNCGIEFPGNLLCSEGNASLMIKPDNLIVIEVQGESGKYIFKRVKAFLRTTCTNCSGLRIIIISCKCGLVIYSNYYIRLGIVQRSVN